MENRLMNNDVRQEIKRLISRTRPEMPDSPLMILAKWVYLDAAAIADKAGQKAVAELIRNRIKAELVAFIESGH